ncbi:hypothetical protein F5X99DRAFT_420660 [Biscogniauxia marginata]|nr:hypothetical protein F5X99DRAFT_420660 [Biscogniauxia marginata]
MAPTIDIIRNGTTFISRDPVLTPHGERLCSDLGLAYPFMDNITNLVVSPMRSAIQTCMEAFQSIIFQSGKKLILLPELQETSRSNLYTPLPLDAFDTLGSYKRFIDTTNVDRGSHLKGPETRFWPSLEKVEARARCARNFIRDLARTAGADAHIIIVTHGAFAHFLTQDFSGLVPGANTAWPRAGMRSYQFVHLERWDDDAALVETERSRAGRAQPAWADLDEADRARLRGIAVEELRKEAAGPETDDEFMMSGALPIP